MKKLLTGVVLIASLFIASCNSAGKGDPKSVLLSFFDALTKKDISGAKKLATEDSKAMFDMMEMGMKMGGDNKDMAKYNKEKMEFGDATIEGDKATVPVKDKTSGESVNYTLKKVGDSWKVAFDKATVMGMGMDKMKEKGMNMDSLSNGLDKLKNMNMDSLSDKVKEGLEKVQDATKKLNENQ